MAAGLRRVPLDAPAVTFSDLVLDEGGEEACGWPGFLIGACRELTPGLLDGRQAEFVENERETLGIERGVTHAPSPVSRLL